MLVRSMLDHVIICFLPLPLWIHARPVDTARLVGVHPT